MSANAKSSGRLRDAGHSALLILLFSCSGWAQAPPQPQGGPGDLTQVSIENLMNMEVTSVSRKEQKLSQVAAAIFVITPEDIRRSAATNIPDLLRMVPGLDVAQINLNTWAISARGFNLQFANKLLVLIDGRAVYTPLFGGVYWDSQDVPLEDIERIEVIRGPGDTVWGANAVNGVINIITKKAADTQGSLVTGGGGTQPQGFGTLQFGGKIKDTASYRVFAKYLNADHFPNLDGQNADDGWHFLHTGFRVDASVATKDSLTMQGDIYTGEEGATIVHSSLSPPENINVQEVAALSGGNILSRWNHVFSSRSDAAVQFYFDRYERDGPESDEIRDTFDFDFQNHINLSDRQDLIWGAGYRHTDDYTVGTIDQAFSPAGDGGHLINAFVQDQLTISPDRITLYLGTKIENNYFSRFDLEPSARLAWTPNTRQTFWVAVSRASRPPTRRDTGLNAALAAFPGPTEVALFGNPNMQTEHVVAYEAGYRTQLTDRFSLDLATFFNDYHGLESEERLPPFIDAAFSPPLLVHPLSFGNKMYGTTEGVEAFVKWKLTNRWTLSPAYSFIQMHLHTDASSTDSVTVVDTQGSSPQHQAQLRSHFEMPFRSAWDTNAYFVGRLPAQGVASFTRLDTQLTWRLGERVELSVVAQNLLRDHHLEFNDQLQSVNSSQVKRSAFAKITWQF